MASTLVDRNTDAAARVATRGGIRMLSEPGRCKTAHRVAARALG